MSHYPPKRWINRVWQSVPMPSYTRDLRTTAYHEAGHAVLLLAFGVPIREVCLDISSAEPNFVGGGYVAQDKVMIAELREELALNRPPIDADRKQKSEQEGALWAAASYLAGEQAELILHGITVNGPVFLPSADQKVAKNMLREAFRHTHGIFYCQRLARAILMDLWPAAEAIANALLKAGRLDSDQVNEAVRAINADC